MNDACFLKCGNSLMETGDPVELILSDKPIAGSVLKVYTAPGWKGYVRLLLEDKRQVDAPVACVRMLDGNV